MGNSPFCSNDVEKCYTHSYIFVKICYIYWGIVLNIGNGMFIDIDGVDIGINTVLWLFYSLMTKAWSVKLTITMQS